MDKKFIITKDYRHFTSDIFDHNIIASKNGYSIKDIIITGLIIDKRLIILECYNQKHLDKIKDTNRFMLKDVNNFQDKLIKTRQIESKYRYNKCLTGLKDGD